MFNDRLKKINYKLSGKCTKCGGTKLADWRLTGPCCPVCDLIPGFVHPDDRK